MNKKVIVIGAGCSGLATAVKLQYLGYKVTIFEKNPNAGGRIYRIQEKGYIFDYGPTITLLPNEYKQVFDFTNSNYKDYYDITPLKTLYELHYSDNSSIKISSEFSKLIAEVQKFGDHEVSGYISFLSDLNKKYQLANKNFLERDLRKRELLRPTMIRNILRLTPFQNAYKLLSKYIKSEKLRQALSFQTLYIGLSPFQGPSIYNIISMIEHTYGIHYIKGGMYSYVEALVKRFKELGGEIVYDSPVKEIIVENGTANGIRLSDRIEKADIIVNNSDFPWAIENLIKNENNRKKYKNKKLRKFKYSSSVMIIYLGLKKKYSSEVHSLKFSSNFKKNIYELNNGIIPNDPSFYLYSPTQIDQSLAPKGKEILNILVPVPNTFKEDVWDKSFTSEYSKKIIDLVSKLEKYSDIKENIEVIKVSNPNDWKTKFNLNYGSTFGLMPSLNQSLYFRPQVKIKEIKNLYFSGSSVHPGPGIPIVLKSSKIVVNKILEDNNDSIR